MIYIYIGICVCMHVHCPCTVRFGCCRVARKQKCLDELFHYMPSLRQCSKSGKALSVCFLFVSVVFLNCILPSSKLWTEHNLHNNIFFLFPWTHRYRLTTDRLCIEILLPVTHTVCVSVLRAWMCFCVCVCDCVQVCNVIVCAVYRT